MSRTRWRSLRNSVVGICAVLGTVAGCGDDDLGAASSTDLRARLAGETWHLEFVSGDDIVLEEAFAGEGVVGPLAFQTEDGWFHATEIVQREARSDGFEVVAASNHPSGQRWRVTFVNESSAVVAVHARPEEPAIVGIASFGISFHSESSEMFFGFGERSQAVEQSGRIIENYVSDGPYLPEERPTVGAIVPFPGFRHRDDATYYPVPWLLSSRGYGVLIDNDETSYFDLLASDPTTWTLEVQAVPDGMPDAPPPRELRFRVFAGPRPVDALARFTESTGRQPAAAAPWVFGPWFQPGGGVDEQVAQLEQLRRADAPVSVSQTYTHYLPCGSHLGRPDGERDRTRRMHDLGVAVTTYFNPMVCVDLEPAFSDGVALGAFGLDEDGEPYVYKYAGSRIFEIAQVDFSSDVGVAYYGDLLGEAVANGYDGWMEDFGEYTPLDIQVADGARGSAAHNRYATQYHCGAFDFVEQASRPLVRYQRSGWTGAAPCAQVVWGGDPSTAWGFDGLRSAMWNGLNMGLSGIALWGSDIGGFFALAADPLSDELLKRWVQLGALSGVMRMQRNGASLHMDQRPQVEDADQIAHWRRYTKLRTQLYPYLENAAVAYQTSGVPLMRHHLLDFHDDPSATTRDDQYLFGPDILVAPVVEQGARTRSVYLPAGQWVDLWRSVELDESDGGLVVGATRIMSGGQTVELPAPLDEIPLLIRAGAVLPLLSPDVDTLADYGDPESGLVRLADRKDILHLLAFPRSDWTGGFGSDGTLRSVVSAGRWDLEIEAPSPTGFWLQASLAAMDESFVACELTWNEEALGKEEWEYDELTRVLRAAFRGEGGRFSVHSCAG